jgi:hypothetical protein
MRSNRSDADDDARSHVLLEYVLNDTTTPEEAVSRLYDFDEALSAKSWKKSLEELSALPIKKLLQNLSDNSREKLAILLRVAGEPDTLKLLVKYSRKLDSGATYARVKLQYAACLEETGETRRAVVIFRSLCYCAELVVAVDAVAAVARLEAETDPASAIERLKNAILKSYGPKIPLLMQLASICESLDNTAAAGAMRACIEEAEAGADPLVVLGRLDRIFHGSWGNVADGADGAVNIANGGGAAAISDNFQDSSSVSSALRHPIAPNSPTETRHYAPPITRAVVAPHLLDEVRAFIPSAIAGGPDDCSSRLATGDESLVIEFMSCASWFETRNFLLHYPEMATSTKMRAILLQMANRLEEAGIPDVDNGASLHLTVIDSVASRGLDATFISLWGYDDLTCGSTLAILMGTLNEALSLYLEQSVTRYLRYAFEMMHEIVRYEDLTTLPPLRTAALLDRAGHALQEYILAEGWTPEVVAATSAWHGQAALLDKQLIGGRANPPWTHLERAVVVEYKMRAAALLAQAKSPTSSSRKKAQVLKVLQQAADVAAEDSQSRAVVLITQALVLLGSDLVKDVDAGRQVLWQSVEALKSSPLGRPSEQQLDGYVTQFASTLIYGGEWWNNEGDVTRVLDFIEYLFDSAESAWRPTLLEAVAVVLGRAKYSVAQALLGRFVSEVEASAHIELHAQEEHPAPRVRTKNLMRLSLASLVLYEYTRQTQLTILSAECITAALKAWPIEQSFDSHMAADIALQMRQVYLATGDERIVDDARTLLRPRLDVGDSNPTLLARYIDLLVLASVGSGAIAFLDEAIEYGQVDKRAAHDDDVQRSLARALENRGSITRDPRDLDAAIDIYRLQVAMDSPSPLEAAQRLGHLGGCLLRRYALTEDVTSILEAVDFLELAAESLPRGAVQTASYLANLATAHLQAYELTDDGSYADRGLAAMKTATRLSGADSIERVWMLGGLAGAYVISANVHGRGVDARLASRLFRASCHLGSKLGVDVNMQAMNWSTWATLIGAWDEVVEANQFGAHQAIELADAQLTRFHKEVRIADLGMFAANASYAHVVQGKLAEAVMSLEQGRAYMLSQTLSIRALDLTALKEGGHEDLAWKLGILLADPEVNDHWDA